MRKKPSQHGGHSGHSGGHSGGHGGHGGHRNNRNRKFRGGGGSGGGGGGGGGNDYQSLQRQKKHAMTQKDKYNAMARDQLANGDRVNAEFYFQHVEHYTRVLADIAEKEPPQFQRNQQQDGEDVAEGAEMQDEGAAVASSANEAPDEIPLPGGLFGDGEGDRVANG